MISLLLAQSSPSPVVVVTGGESTLVVSLVAVASALFGALASYRASVSLQNKVHETRAAIRRKSKVYTPLLNDLTELREALHRIGNEGWSILLLQRVLPSGWSCWGVLATRL